MGVSKLGFPPGRTAPRYTSSRFYGDLQSILLTCDFPVFKVSLGTLMVFVQLKAWTGSKFVSFKRTMYGI